ncbi:hypothetical protein FGB62_1g688 [Gracilaria domingensis]|nr:hypothetical protein FGB62_1g688 [Gracilaria domingensis]
MVVGLAALSLGRSSGAKEGGGENREDKWKGSRILNANVSAVCGLEDVAGLGTSFEGCWTRWECGSKPRNVTETPANGSSSTDGQQPCVGDGVAGPLEQRRGDNEAPERARPNRRARRRRVQCWHCRRRGHTREQCWYYRPEGNAVVDEHSQQE